MPSIEQSTEICDRTYSWPQQADESSEACENTRAMSWFVLCLHRYVPADTILELAPGHGR